MTIKTSRTNEDGRIIINYARCKACGACVTVCKDLDLVIEDGRLAVSRNSFFGCLACGQCAAVCPNEAIHVVGRCAAEDDYVRMPSRGEMADYGQLNSLMLGRRSVRDFKPEEVPNDIAEKIISAASTAPMGIPPSDVGLLVLGGRKKVRQFSFDFIDYAESIKWAFSPFMITLMRPFIGRDNYEAFKSFIIPLFDFLIEGRHKDEDWLLYDAPLAIYFYSLPFADPCIAATYAMLAAEALGLGSCMIGTVGPLFKRGGAKLKKKYGINPKGKDGIVVIFGYPKFKYHRAIRRTFAEVKTP